MYVRKILWYMFSLYYFDSSSKSNRYKYVKTKLDYRLIPIFLFGLSHIYQDKTHINSYLSR